MEMWYTGEREREEQEKYVQHNRKWARAFTGLKLKGSKKIDVEEMNNI